MTTPLIVELARLREAERAQAAARRYPPEHASRDRRAGIALRPALADALRRLASQLDGKPASSLTAR